ncbi:MAG TPA: hypothetical protein VJN96_08830 [Vicinamibacterales bacterium]|nr:hypothetical protein [Vicinamibacterales bacterium]
MRKALSTAFAVVLLVSLGSRPAHASPIALALLDSLGHSSGVIIDGSAGDADPADGVVSFSGVIGDWTVNTTSGSGGVPGVMGLNSLNASASTTSSLFVLFTQLDDTAIGSFNGSFLAVMQNGTAAYGAFGDAGNAGFAQTSPIGAAGPFTAGNAFQTFSDTFIGPGPVSGPYSLTQLFVISGNGEGATIFGGQAELHPAPEPVSLILVGSGMAAAGLRARRAARRHS